MVALASLDRSAGPLLRKAALLAKAHATSVRLVHVIALPRGPLINAAANVRRAAQDQMEEQDRKLRKLANGSELRGIATSMAVVWDYPAADGIVREVLKHRPGLLLVGSHRHGRLARMWLTNTDWELIRNCPCPLWLSKSARWSAHGKVIAALDPFHAHAKPAALDDVILQHAIAAADGKRTRVLACHTYTLPQPVPIDGAMEPYWPALSRGEQQALEATIRQRITTLTKRWKIPLQNTVVASGDPLLVLPRLATKHAAKVVVMGAVSRSALQRVFIGHTAERVIDGLSCDVLIVKPRGFRTAVRRRARR